jgi:hypothetical protein
VNRRGFVPESSQDYVFYVHPEHARELKARVQKERNKRTINVPYFIIGTVRGAFTAFFMLVIWFWATFTLFTDFVPQIQAGIVFANGSQPVTAQVTDKRLLDNTSRGAAQRPQLTYSYTVDGQSYTGSATVSRDMYRNTAVGASMTVYYAASMPAASSRYEDGSFETLTNVVGALMILWFVVGIPAYAIIRLYYWWFGTDNASGDKRILKAEIIRVETGQSSAMGRWADLHYRFSPPGRRDTVEGVYHLYGKELASTQLPVAGTPARVLYYPEDNVFDLV